MIEFKQLVAGGNEYHVELVLIDGEHVGYWCTHDAAAMTLLKSLSPAEIEAICNAAKEARGWVPKVIRQPETRPKKGG